jgi:hypothetical protein
MICDNLSLKDLMMLHFQWASQWGNGDSGLATPAAAADQLQISIMITNMLEY